MKLSRLHRLLRLIGLLQAGRGYNVEALALECAVCRRTVFRDLDLLRRSGVPLTYDEQQQRYRIPGTYYLPPTNFSPEEALSLIVLCHELGTESGLPFFAPARRAALKLESSLPLRLREQLRGMTTALQIRPPPSNVLAGQQSVYDVLLKAFSQNRCVRIGYKSPREPGQMRTKLSPYRLFFSRRSWYVIGRSSLHRGTRTFNLGRIAQIELLEDQYQVPRGFSLARYLRNAWHLIPEPGPDQEVLVRFSKVVAQNVGEVAWHKTQRLKFNDDGTLDYSVTVSGLGEISWWILGYGDEAEVIKPPKLRRLVAERVRRMVELYGDT